MKKALFFLLFAGSVYAQPTRLTLPHGGTAPWLSSDTEKVLTSRGAGVPAWEKIPKVDSSKSADTVNLQHVITFSGGATGLTPGSPSSGAITLGGVLNVLSGGTGTTSLGNFAISMFGDTAGKTLQVVTIRPDGTIGWDTITRGGGGASGASGGQILTSSFADVNITFTANKYFAPFGSDFSFNSGANQAHPADSNGNISIVSSEGVLKNWRIQTNEAATNDSFIIYRSTDRGATWNATPLEIVMKSGKTGSDLVHSIAVNPGDWLALYYTKFSDNTNITDAIASYEFDPIGGSESPAFNPATISIVNGPTTVTTTNYVQEDTNSATVYDTLPAVPLLGQQYWFINPTSTNAHAVVPNIGQQILPSGALAGNAAVLMATNSSFPEAASFVIVYLGNGIWYYK